MGKELEKLLSLFEESYSMYRKELFEGLYIEYRIGSQKFFITNDINKQEIPFIVAKLLVNKTEVTK